MLVFDTFFFAELLVFDTCCIYKRNKLLMYCNNENGKLKPWYVAMALEFKIERFINFILFSFYFIFNSAYTEKKIN